jgi:uncharacterized membrane protein
MLDLALAVIHHLLIFALFALLPVLAAAMARGYGEV